MKRFITLLIAGMLAFGVTNTATAYAKSIDPDDGRPQMRMMIIDPDDGRPEV